MIGAERPALADLSPLLWLAGLVAVVLVAFVVYNELTMRRGSVDASRRAADARLLAARRRRRLGRAAQRPTSPERIADGGAGRPTRWRWSSRPRRGSGHR